jgi:hypothetical protein
LGEIREKYGREQNNSYFPFKINGLQAGGGDATPKKRDATPKKRDATPNSCATQRRALWITFCPFFQALCRLIFCRKKARKSELF